MPINKKHFKQLTIDRKDSLRLLNKTSMRGIRDSIIEKYSEQAHFVYELLQNADDVNATYVRFKVREEGLYFIHNGRVPFTVTPPNQTPVGHINAITSIGHSSKKEATYKIGKFGIGFKSVFQYTSTPHIYDPHISFRIRDLIVPELLEEQEHPMKTADETLFFFPFNHPDKSAEIARQEINTRLQALQFPLLFLNHLQKIEWETTEATGSYKKEIQAVQEEEGILVQELLCLKKIGKKTTTHHLLQFIKKETKLHLSYSLVFLQNESKHIIGADTFSAHCFFPTRVPTNLQFLIHAPFLLTDSREGIKLEDKWNKSLIQKLAILLPESIFAIKKMGLLRTSFFRILPFDDAVFKGASGHFFLPFYQELYTFLSTPEQAVFPVAEDNFSTLTNAFLAESQSLRNLLDTKQLRLLTNQEQANWIFPALSSQTALGQFIRQLIHQNMGSRSLSPILNWETALRLMESDFLEKQTDDWLIYFYTELLQNHRALWSGHKALAKEKPIIRLENGRMVLPFDKVTGTPNAYIPTQLATEYPTVKRALVEEELAKSFLESLGLSTPVSVSYTHLTLPTKA